MALREYDIELNALLATVQLDEGNAKALGLIPEHEPATTQKTGRNPRAPRKEPKAKPTRPLVTDADTASYPGASE
ncbi:hypothetical protein [Microbacterium paraoxydans]|uniref:hypothetical protein n=1 Tax=Microbacterium paraoxydans TaxID=199592 RepID=UPI003D75C24F